MKNKNKLRSGMTLVEVVVAMAVFAVMTLGITMTFAAVVKYNARNMRRDYELNRQQTAIEKNTIDDMKIFKNSFKGRSLQYVAPDGTVLGSIDEVTEYNAVKSQQNASDINFEVKTFSSVPLGSQPVSFNKDDYKFKLSFTNMSQSTVDVRIETTEGTIYEGDADTGYRHSSPLYKRVMSPASYDDTGSMQAPSGFEIGFDNPAADYSNINYTSSSLRLSVYVDGSVKLSSNIPNDWFTSSSTGELSVTVKTDGTIETVVN